MNSPRTHAALHEAISEQLRRVSSFAASSAAIGCGDPDAEIEMARGLAAAARMLASAADELGRYVSDVRFDEKCGKPF